MLSQKIKNVKKYVAELDQDRFSS